MNKLIWINPKGGFGNRVLQYLAAEGIRRRVPEAKIINVILPELEMYNPARRPSTKDRIVIKQVENLLDLNWIAQKLNNSANAAVLIEDCWAQHIDNFPPRNDSRSLIGPYKGGEDAVGFNGKQLLCNVRADEILKAVHPDYVPLPPAYYQMLQERSGLDLVFLGQLSDDVYSRNLRAAFPKSRFITSLGPAMDFETIRRSVNVAICISTFSWLAAWLGNAKQVFLPICGLFNPAQSPFQNFLPINEETYHFTLFPATQSIDLTKNPDFFYHGQQILSEKARWIDREELHMITARRNDILDNRLIKKNRSRKPRLRTPRKMSFDIFDRLFYAEKCAFCLLALRKGWRVASNHFRWYNLSMGHAPLLADLSHYYLNYPDAASAISEGHFVDAYDHYVKVGRHNGFTLTNYDRRKRK